MAVTSCNSYVQSILMETLRHILGISIFAYGFLIILMYWVYWVRVAASKFGIGRVKFTSMAPFVGPLLLVVGAFIHGPQLTQSLGWWILLIDINTYIFIISVPIAAWLHIRKSGVKPNR